MPARRFDMQGGSCWDRGTLHFIRSRTAFYERNQRGWAVSFQSLKKTTLVARRGQLKLSAVSALADKKLLWKEGKRSGVVD